MPLKKNVQGSVKFLEFIITKKDMGIHKIEKDGNVSEYKTVPVSREDEIENFLERHPSILEKDLFILGRQVITSDGSKVDLMGLDKNGDVIIVELKKGETTRKVVSQILEYGVWAEPLEYDALNQIAKQHSNLSNYPNLWRKFEAEIGFVPETFNENQRLYIVAEKIDNTTEKITRYLKERGINISCIELRFFDGDDGSIVNTRHVVGEERITHPNIESDSEEYDWNYYTNKKGWSDKQINATKLWIQEFEEFSKKREWETFVQFNKKYVAFKDKRKRNFLALKNRRGLMRIEVRVKVPIKELEQSLDWKWYDPHQYWYCEIDSDEMPKIEDLEKILTHVHDL